MPSATPVRVVLLGASFDTDNMGVGALAAGTIKSLLYQFPCAEISLLDYAKRPKVCTVQVNQTKVRIPLLNIRFSWKFYLANNIALLILIAIMAKLIPVKKARHWVINSNRSLRELSKADVCSSVAGGDSFSDIYGLVRLLYTSLPQALVLLLGKRLILLPQTIGPFRSRAARLIANFIMTRAERIYTRDIKSITTVEHCIGRESGKGRICLCYDLAFVLDAVHPSNMVVVGLNETGGSRATLVGLNVSGLLMMGGYTRKNMFGLKTSYEALVRLIIDYIIRTEHAHVLLIPHVFGTDINSESDLVACERIYRDLSREYGETIGFVSSRHNQSEIKKIIGSCNFFVGARMHACIAALSQNIPAIALAYSDKFVGVMQTIGVDDLVVDPRTMNEEEILKALAKAYKERTLIRQKLERRMPEVREAVLNLFGFLDTFEQLPVQTRPD